jgi:hypothetical protein
MVILRNLHMSLHVVARRWWPGTWFMKWGVHLDALRWIPPWITSRAGVLVLLERLHGLFFRFLDIGARRCTEKRAWECRHAYNGVSRCPPTDSTMKCINTRGAAIARAFTWLIFVFSRYQCTSLHDEEGLRLLSCIESFISMSFNRFHRELNEYRRCCSE